MNKHEVDFFLSFASPIVGLVSKITSPKGVRHVEGSDVKYGLHAELVDVYSEGKATFVESGLYWVVCIYKKDTELIRTSYLFVVTDSGSLRPIAEYLGYPELTWIPDAIPLLKAYFNNGSLPLITLTPVEVPVKKEERKEDKRFRVKSKN